MNDPSQRLIYNPFGGIHRSPLDSYSLADLIKLREDLVGQKKDIIEKWGKRNYAMVMGKVQSYIWKKRTHTKSGLIVPYDKDKVND